MKIVIPGVFPGLNQFVDANRVSRGRWNKGNSMKQRDQATIRSYLPRWKTEKKVYIKYTFYEPNKKRDMDNISGYFHKVFQDSLVEARVIPNDGWKYIKGFEDSFFVDKGYPRVEVEIIEV